jgi:hypothetical protein
MAEDAHFRLRLPADLHRQLAELAEKNHRSINAEIVARLQSSLDLDAYDIAGIADDLEKLQDRVSKIEDRLWDDPSNYD